MRVCEGQILSACSTLEIVRDKQNSLIRDDKETTTAERCSCRKISSTMHEYRLLARSELYVTL